MSLINKMLQDLDARGGAAGVPPQAAIKLVPRSERRPMRPMMAGGALLLAALAAGGYFGWRAMARTRPVAAVAAVVAAPPVKTVLLAPLPPVKTALPAPLEPAPVPAAEAGPVAPAPIAREAPPLPRKEKPVEKSSVAAIKKPEAAPVAAPSQPMAATLSPAQRAETEYRRALANLAEGRTVDAIAGLEQALLIDSRHEAARQTLVGLLIEKGRPDDAMRQLQVALASDPRQPAMAMLLARLQIERGGSGVDTLQRSLPYAAGNGEYHAFLAGALQRQGRHREAAEQYGAALRGNPQNGVWLMGMGISLQAEKRNAEAIDAFQKAKASVSLAPELQAFVERKLLQMGQ